MTRRPPKPPSEDDEAIWATVAASVTPLRGKKQRRRVASPPPGKPLQRKGESATPPLLPLPPSPAASAPPRATGFDRATEARLRKGALPIEGTLDLHGMTQTEAHAALLRFVARARAQDKRTLLIITGKGGVKQGGGVLRRMLPLWCEADPTLSTHILACAPAALKDGGEGAFYLRLRKTR